MIALWVNGRRYVVDVPGETPLLWVLRDRLGFTATKFGCGIGVCGACTVHLEGRAERACQVPVSAAVNRAVTTLEGLPADHPLLAAWVDVQVPQCGWCQPGQIMQAASLLASNPVPSDAEIVEALDGNLCRCGTYRRIHRAVRQAAAVLPAEAAAGGDGARDAGPGSGPDGGPGDTSGSRTRGDAGGGGEDGGARPPADGGPR